MTIPAEREAALTHTQECARRFNEEEAVWQCYQHKRRLRHILGSSTPLPEATLDWIDWQAAERECREVRAIGFFSENQDNGSNFPVTFRQINCVKREQS